MAEALTGFPRLCPTRPRPSFAKPRRGLSKLKCDGRIRFMRFTSQPDYSNCRRPDQAVFMTRCPFPDQAARQIVWAA